MNEQHTEQSMEVTVQAGKVTLDGNLSIPNDPRDSLYSLMAVAAAGSAVETAMSPGC